MDSFVEGIPEGLSVIKRTNKGACLESLECDSQALTDLSLSRPRVLFRETWSMDPTVSDPLLFLESFSLGYNFFFRETVTWWLEHRHQKPNGRTCCFEFLEAQGTSLDGPALEWYLTLMIEGEGMTEKGRRRPLHSQKY